MSDNNDLMKALSEINDEMGISSSFIKERISKAICAVCRNTYGVEDPVVEFDESGKLSVKIKKTICQYLIQKKYNCFIKKHSTFKANFKLQCFY